MPLLYEPNYLLQHEILIRELAFVREADSDSVTLFGDFPHPVTYQPEDRDFGCDFSLLTDLLLLAGAEGQLVASEIVWMLGNEHIDPEEPVVLDVEGLLGDALKIRGVLFRIYKPMERRDKGAWEEMEDDYYLIDGFKKLTPEELRQYHLEQHLSGLMQTLAKAYRQYKRWRQLSFSKKEARKKAGLKDDFLFRLAKTQYGISKGDVA